MKRLVFIAVFLFFLLGIASAQNDSIMLENLHRMRIKQQDEEMVIRAQIFKSAGPESNCTPVQQVRQRIRDIGTGKTTDKSITINAGHEELNVEDNHGTINSDVNVNVIKQGSDRDCL